MSELTNILDSIIVTPTIYQGALMVLAMLPLLALVSHALPCGVKHTYQMPMVVLLFFVMGLGVSHLLPSLELRVLMGLLWALSAMAYLILLKHKTTKHSS